VSGVEHILPGIVTFVSLSILSVVGSGWLCPIPTGARALAGAVVGLFAMVMATEALSLLELVRPWPVALATLATAGGAALLEKLRARRGTRRPASGAAERPTETVPHDSSRVVPTRCIMLLATPILAGVAALAVTAWAVPPNNYDSNNYHLPRSIQWLHQGSLDHFPTRYPPQNIMPANNEITYLWLAMFLRNDLLFNLSTWLFLPAAMLAVYLLSQRIGLDRRAAVVAALMLPCMSEVAAQATTQQGDLNTAFYLLCCVLFVLMWADTHGTGCLIAAGMSLTLLVGSKTVALLWVPPLLGIILWATLRQRRRGPSLILAALVSGAAIAAGSGGYVRNLTHYGHPLGGVATHGERSQAVGPAATAANLFRYAVQAVAQVPLSLTPYLGEAGKQINQTVEGLVRRAGRTVTAVFGPDAELSSKPSDAELQRFSMSVNEDMLFYGPVGLAAAVLGSVVPFVALRRRNARFRRGALLSLACWCFTILFCSLVAHSVWRSRLMLSAHLLAAPLVGLLFAPFAWRKGFVGLALGVLGVGSLWSVVLFNWSKPWVANEDGPGIWSLTREQRRVRPLGGSAHQEFFDRLNNVFPAEAKLGLLLPAGFWEVPLFGPRFERMLVHLPGGTSCVDVKLLDRWELDAVILQPDAFPHCRWDENELTRANTHPFLHFLTRKDTDRRPGT